MKFHSHILALVNDKLQKFEIEDIDEKGRVKVKEIRGYRLGPKTYGNKVEEIIEKQAGKKPSESSKLIIWGNKFLWETPLKKVQLPNSSDFAYDFYSATIPFHQSAVFSTIEEAVHSINVEPIGEPDKPKKPSKIKTKKTQSGTDEENLPETDEKTDEN